MRVRDSESSPIDFCKSCWNKIGKDEMEDRYKEANVPADDNEGRGCCYEYNDETPPYSEWGDYQCEECGIELTDKCA